MSNTDNNKPNPAMGTGPGKSGKENADMDRDTTADTEMDFDFAKGEVNPGEPAPATGNSPVEPREHKESN